MKDIYQLINWQGIEQDRKPDYGNFAFELKKKDLKDLKGWRDVIPEYVKDYVSLNTFM